MYLSGTDAAVHSASPLNVGVLADNKTSVDSYGDYGVCDFDGDGIDDLFPATGVTWWYSSERMKDVRLGYFDDDKRCDVLAQFGPEWRYVSGGYGEWKLLSAAETPLTEAALGRFDVSDTSSQPGVTLKTTHALRRASSGQWEVTPLVDPPVWSSSYTINGPNGPETKNLQNSSVAFKNLRFGDFTGDGVTDVLAVRGGRWKISKSALEQWHELNSEIGEDLSALKIANMDTIDNIDDILKLKSKMIGSSTIEVTWLRSHNGSGEWLPFATHSFAIGQFGDAKNVRGFEGRFGTTSGRETLVVDPERIGHFHSITETHPMTGQPDWQSMNPY